MGYYPGLSSASLEITDSTAGADTSLTGTKCLTVLNFSCLCQSYEVRFEFIDFILQGKMM